MHRKVAWIVHQVTQQIEALSGKAGPALDRDRQHVRGIDEADGVREAPSAKANRVASDVSFDIRCNRARDQIVAAAGRVSNNHVDRLLRIGGMACSRQPAL